MGLFSQALGRLVPARVRGLPAINPAGEGNWHAGPYRITTGSEAGFYPYASMPWNFWQCDIEPMGAGGSSIVEACVWAYVRAIAQLPGYHREEEDDGGVENITTSALSRLLRFPNSYQTRSDWLTHVVRSLLYTGNSYSLAVRNNRSEVVELHWLDPRSCFVQTVKVKGQENAEVFYSIGDNPVVNFDALDSLAGRVFPARDILHIKLATPRDPLKGESPLECLWIDLANRAAINSSVSSFLANASRPSGVISTDAELTQAQIDSLREMWAKQSSGQNQGKVPILTRGLKWQQTGISNEDTQLIDALKITDKTIVGVFGVPGVLVGVQDNAPFASTEALMNWWLANGLGYVLDHIETAIDQFIGLPSNEWTEFDTDALLRANTAERIDSLVKGVQGGIYAPNEARAKEGYPAVEAGDEPRVQQQVVPLSFASAPPQPPAQTPPAPPAPDAPPSAEPADAGGDDGQAAMVSYEAVRRFIDERRLAA